MIKKEHPFFRFLLKILWYLYAPAVVAAFTGIIIFFATLFQGDFKTAGVGLSIVLFMLLYHFLIIKKIIEKLSYSDCENLIKELSDSQSMYFNTGYLIQLLTHKINTLNIHRIDTFRKIYK